MANKVHVDIVTALTRYKERIQVEYEDEFAGEHKQSLIGRKWSKQNAIGQLDFVICKIRMLFSEDNIMINPEQDPLWHLLP